MQNPVLKNVESGQIIELIKSPFTIGRSLTSDYVIENKIVSRIHCSLTRTDEGWTLTDSSTNGTLVNDGHYKGDTSPVLNHNDEISLGYESFTYRFITEVEKVPNCQVEKLRNQETSGKNPTVLNEVCSPGTPHSFDENGVSDEVLNNLADDILDTVDQQPNVAESHASANNLLDIPGQCIETSAANVNSIRSSTVISEVLESDNGALNQLNIRGSNLGEVVATDKLNNDMPELVNTINELNEQHNDSPQLSSNSSISTVIYSLPEDIPHHSQSNNSISTVGYSLPEDIPHVQSNSSISTLSYSLPKDIPHHLQSNSSISTVMYSLPEDIPRGVPQPVIGHSTEKKGTHLNVEQIGSRITQENMDSTNPTSLSSNPRNHLSECIEAVVQRYSQNAPTNSGPAVASTSGQGTSLVSNTNTASIPSSSVTVTSTVNANKKVKVMSVSSEVINQLRPVAGQALTAYTVGSGQQAPVVRRLTQNEMQRILANQPKMPVLILDKVSVGGSPASVIRTYNSGAQSTTAHSTRLSGNNTTVTSSAAVSPSPANSTGRITELEGIKRSVHNPDLSQSTKSGLIRALREYRRNHPEVPSTTSLIGTGNAILQAAEDRNTSGSCTMVYPSSSFLQIAGNHSTSTNRHILASGNSLLQAAEDQNTTGSCTAIVSRNTPLHSAGIQHTTAGSTVLVSGYASGVVSDSNNEVVDSMSVPAAAHEVVIENTIENMGDVRISAANTCANQKVPGMKCHDSQEPGPSTAQAKLGASKQNNQNHYEEMENELMCTICANLFIKAVTLGCSHSFCQYCIGEWKKKKTECPICRNKISSTTRTLVLDNIIEKMLETASEEDKQDRKAALEERKKIEEDEIAKKNQQQNTNKNRGGMRGRRGVRGNARNNRRNTAQNQPATPAPVITIVDDSPSTTDSDNSDNDDEYDYDDYYGDDWYNGRSGAYYGGYGRCYSCGESGHWSNGCPYR